MKRRALAVAGSILTVSATMATVAACTLNFDRYSTSEDDASGPDSSADAIPTPPGADASAPTDAAAPDASDQRVSDGAACTPDPSCFQATASCATGCGDQLSQCTAGCTVDACTQSCTSAKQSCLGGCAATCIACERDAGCPQPAMCLSIASH